MRILTTTMILTLLLAMGCSPSPEPTYNYEGVWTDATIPLTLTVGVGVDGSYPYGLSSDGTVYLTGTLLGQPDGSVAIIYDDGGQRRIELIGAISGDTLTGTFTHTGLVPQEYDVDMERE